MLQRWNSIPKKMAPLISLFTRSSIIALLFTGGPAAIIGLIVPVIVYSVYRVLFGRSWSHIKKECLERIIPSVANVNSSPSIIFIPRVIRVIGSRFHSSPYAPLIRESAPMRFMDLRRPLLLETSAALGVSATQLIQIRGHCVSAITRTNPLCSTSIFKPRKGDKSAKPLACYILDIARSAYVFLVSHNRSHVRFWLGQSPVSIIGVCLISFPVIFRGCTA